MHPYLFFYFLGGVTFIPITLVITLFVLWLRLPNFDPSKPRPTDLPPPHLLQEQIEKDLANGFTVNNGNINGFPSISPPSSEKSSSIRKRKEVLQSRSKSENVLQTFPKSSSASVTSSSSSSSSAAAAAAATIATSTPALLKSPQKKPTRINSGSSDDAEGVEADGDDDKEDGDGDDAHPDSDDDNDTINNSEKDIKDNIPEKTPVQSRVPDVPMQSDPNLNREGHVRMTRVPRLGPAAESISDYMTNMLFQPKNARPKDSYYAVLRDQQRDCKAVVPMTLYEVKIFPQNLPDNEVFNKEHPIQIKRKPNTTGNAAAVIANTGQDEYYIFIHTPVIKEDWYLALLYASKLRKPGTKQKIQDKAQFDLEAIQNHIRILYSDRFHEQTRWFNAFIGRLFLGVYKTKKIQEVYIQKITRKTLKLKRPSFLGEIKVKSFNVGHSIPYITKTKLNELLPNGELTAEFFLSYRGGVRVEIEVDVGLGLNSLKPVKVTIVLAVLVKSISGMMTLKVKAPPSNRFWIGFQEPPQMDIVIEPVVADKAIKLNMVISAIESKIREAMVEAIVLPNMDDYPFFDSHGTGGIFEGDEEFSPDPVDDSDGETMAADGKSGKNSSNMPGNKRRDSEGSLSSEHAPPPPFTADRKQSWSSTESDADSEPISAPASVNTTTSSSSIAPGPYISQQNNTTSSSASTLSSSSLASKFKRFSQAHFSSSRSSDLVPEASKLNTKPTVATSIATAIRTSPTATPHFGSSSGSSNGGKLPSLIPKLSALNDAELTGPRIFTSSSPSNGPSKKDSTSSLRRLAGLEPSTSVSDNIDVESSEDGEEPGTPTGNDPLVKALKKSLVADNSSLSSTTPTPNSTGNSVDGSRRAEFDTFPRSAAANGSKKWDHSSALSSGGGGSEVLKSFGDERRRGSLSSSSPHLGIAGILDPSSPPASRNSVSGVSVSQGQGNLANMFNSNRKNSAGSSKADEGSSGGDGEHGGSNSVNSRLESVKEHGRRSSADGLLSLKMKKDALLKKIANRASEEDQGGSTGGTARSLPKFSLESVGTLLANQRRRGSGPDAKGSSSPTPAIAAKRPKSAYEPQMNQELLQAQDTPRRNLVRSVSSSGTTNTTRRKDADMDPSDQALENPNNNNKGEGLLSPPTLLNSTKRSLSSSSNSTSTSTSSSPGSPGSSPGSTLSSRTSFLQMKSQAALGSAKAWMKKSLEDRRLSNGGNDA
ncbi:hypothetical protein BGZ46_001000 [Entomortierella lignicola]|nr:hypothetical protein BGZ46_001000 [Entomortierella lignicola]